jgi:hypothetical protein
MILDQFVKLTEILPDTIYTLALTGLGALWGILITLRAHERRERVSGGEDGMQSWRLTTGPVFSCLAPAGKCGANADPKR